MEPRNPPKKVEEMNEKMEAEPMIEGALEDDNGSAEDYQNSYDVLEFFSEEALASQSIPSVMAEIEAESLLDLALVIYKYVPLESHVTGIFKVICKSILSKMCVTPCLPTLEGTWCTPVNALVIPDYLVDFRIWELFPPSVLLEKKGFSYLHPCASPPHRL